ncbi:MAG: hypothetical protein H6738_02820 [Alphaproteobacteria bacterium]|nr:hypothetical protein [Alphaproteobacteria bacterium]MCB9695703.1 hypothetical protein [Alphaproteobacteria bacterium]
MDIDPWADRRAGLRDRLERARRFERLIATGAVKNAADVASREGITRARVSQILRLLKLAPSILQELEDPEASGPVPPEKELRKLAGVPRPRQPKRYEELVATEGFEGGKAGRGGSPRSRVQRRGLQHQFERARRFQAMLDSGEFRSLEEIGQAEGLTGGRVAQLLNLLHLVPEIIEVVDVAAERVPAGVSERKLRAIARLQDHDEQVWAFRALRQTGALR